MESATPESSKRSDPVFTIEVAHALKCGAEFRLTFSQFNVKPKMPQLQVPDSQDLRDERQIVTLADQYALLLESLLGRSNSVDEDAAPYLQPLISALHVEHLAVTDKMLFLAEIYPAFKKPAERLIQATDRLGAWLGLINDCIERAGDVERGRGSTGVVRIAARGIGAAVVHVAD